MVGSVSIVHGAARHLGQLELYLGAMSGGRGQAAAQAD